MDEHLRAIEAALDVQHCPPARTIQGGRPKALPSAPWRCCRPCTNAARPIAASTVQLMLSGDGDWVTPAFAGHAAPGPETAQQNQACYLDNITEHDITFGIGPRANGQDLPGRGRAVDALQRASVQRVILTRPAVEAGERLGYLPGDLAQKVSTPTCARCTTRCTT